MELVRKVLQPPKKKPKLGRLCEGKQKLLAQSPEVGPDCHCSRLKSFDDSSRKDIICKFNQITNYNEQNQYLGGFITSSLIKQRRP